MWKHALFAPALLCSALSPAPAFAEAPTAQSPAAAQMDHISVQVMGSGDPVILIPGLSSPRAVWDGVASHLAAGHRVYLVQVNGFAGGDPKGNLQPGILDGIVADLDQYIAAQKLNRPAIVGHSMGGALAAKTVHHIFANNQGEEWVGHIKGLNVLEDYTIRNCWPYWDKFDQRVEYDKPSLARDGQHYGIEHHKRFAELFLENFGRKLR